MSVTRVIEITDEKYATEYLMQHEGQSITIKHGGYTDLINPSSAQSIEIRTRTNYELPDRLKKPLLEEEQS